MRSWELVLLLISSLSLVKSVLSSADFTHPNATLSTLAFGSCHKRKYVNASTQTIWQTIASTVDPDAFVWTGDAAYPPVRGIASVDLLRTEYQQLKQNVSLGYSHFQPPQGIYGTWDDHDYGGNDLGVEMPDKEARKDAFFEFLGYPTSTTSSRDGVYHSVEWGESPRKIKAIFLDTRWHREPHCIPSVASEVPLGAGISCLTRWFTAGLGFCNDTTATLLGEAQWEWLEEELLESDAQVHLVVSSVQVLTTNPVMESWGHFPRERARLMRLINERLQMGHTSILLLSGDVHHAEISGTPAAAASSSSLLEITSSGLTHSCDKPFYGGLCEPLLQTFVSHRYSRDSYYIGRNFGSFRFNWESKQMKIMIHDSEGAVVLSTPWRDMDMDALTESELAEIAPCVDGHLIPRARALFVVLAVIVVTGLFFKPLLGKPKTAAPVG